MGYIAKIIYMAFKTEAVPSLKLEEGQNVGEELDVLVELVGRRQRISLLYLFLLMVEN